MLDSEFMEQVQEVIAACTHPEVQKAVFSATLPANAEKVAMSMLRDPIRVVVGLKYVFAFEPTTDLETDPYRQGHAPPSYSPVTHLRLGRPIQATNTPAVPVAALQSSCARFRLITTPRDFVSGGACDLRCSECGLTARWYDEKGA